MSKVAVILGLALVLSGCVVVWGRAYEIEAETSEWITIKYDSNFTSLPDIQQVAQASCDAHDKHAVFRDQSTSILHLTTVDFDCVTKQQS
jgi:PBP1b-binding outer membrane lipoprotein LpoB